MVQVHDYSEKLIKEKKERWFHDTLVTSAHGVAKFLAITSGVLAASLAGGLVIDSFRNTNQQSKK